MKKKLGPRDKTTRGIVLKQNAYSRRPRSRKLLNPCSTLWRGAEEEIMFASDQQIRSWEDRTPGARMQRGSDLPTGWSSFRLQRYNMKNLGY